ncbi:MAG: replicative DNA helicase [Acidobacteriota bacterium]|nr:replicative DNA helicase [Blastocatellia bacterium]MDW8240629.1 replicative DNA helicase [Acidobacteriota bacterium]
MAKSLKEMTTERSLPHSIETERSILGAILIDNTTLHQALEILSRDDFYLDAHRRIFDKMVALFEKDRPIDPITLREELDRSGELEQVGGVSAIAALMDGTPYLRNIEHYAKIVRDRALLRRLIIVSNQIISECFEQEEESDLILDKAEKAILDIAEARTKVGFAPIGEVAKQQLELVEQRAGRPQMITGLATGFIDFDRMTSGLQPSDLIIVAARPSVGKTSFVLSIAQNAALAGHVIGISSLEMSKEQLVMRLLCSEARINMQRFRNGFLNRDEWKRLAEGLRRLAECRIFIDDTPGISPLELRAKARRLKHERGLDLLIVDYLQLMSARGRAESRQQEVSQISRDLKSLAKDLQVPLIAVSQLSRAPEARTDHRPQLSDLRESGSLEQDADVVAFLFREDLYNRTPETEGKAELIVAKQRNGPTGKIELAFLSEFTRFENLMEESAF